MRSSLLLLLPVLMVLAMAGCNRDARNAERDRRFWAAGAKHYGERATEAELRLASLAAQVTDLRNTLKDADRKLSEAKGDVAWETARGAVAAVKDDLAKVEQRHNREADYMEEMRQEAAFHQRECEKLK
jgi:chromosome segregation ATPase